MPRWLWQALFICLKAGQYACDWLGSTFEEAAWAVWERAYPLQQPRSIGGRIDDGGGAWQGSTDPWAAGTTGGDGAEMFLRV